MIPGAPHHVVLRGNNRRRLFSYPRDYNRLLSLMGQHLGRVDISLNAFCLMTNHVHLLLTPGTKAALGEFIKRVAQRYAQIRNRRLRASGKLFEERYYSKPIASVQHLALATVYIDLNPVRAGMLGSGGGDDYRWSTFGIHAGSAKPQPFVDIWTPTSWYVDLAVNPLERASAYREFAEERLALDEWEGVRSDPPAPSGPPVRRPNRTRAAG